jgi:hypothetical protein
MLTVNVQEYDIADVLPRIREGGTVDVRHGATVDR